MNKNQTVSTLVFFSLLVIALPTFALKKVDSSGEFSEVIMALRLPMENRISALKLRPKVHLELEKLVFRKDQSLQNRWRALTIMARLDFQKAKPTLEKALKSPEWFLRNAALVAIQKGDRQMALSWSERLLKDPALVVRTAAAQNLVELKDRNTRASLVSALSDPQNFKNGQSLWVRRHIAQALAEMARPGEESFFISLLSDRDHKLHISGVRGLERITGRPLTEPKNLEQSKARWVAWWESNSTF